MEIYKPTVIEPMALWKSSDGSITPIKMRQEYQSSSSAATQDFSQERKTYTVVSHIEEPYFMLKWVREKRGKNMLKDIQTYFPCYKISGRIMKTFVVRKDLRVMQLT